MNPLTGHALNLNATAKFVASLPSRAKRRLSLILQGRLRCFNLALSLVEGKSGLEIGGPTDIFQTWYFPSRLHGWQSPLAIYDRLGSLDNCNFSRQTMWATHNESYRFSANKAPGKVIIADGSDLTPVADHSYDFVLSSHNLEHFANPVKALKEWKRVTRPNGALILVLPDYRRTFDHRRTPTSVQHMLDDFSRNTGEDDTTHVPEVLQLHDVKRDGTLKTQSYEELHRRSIDNLANRSLHHHVFDESNSEELLKEVGLDVLAIELALPYHMFILSRWK
jgi:predicted SAM-dependent methyltransferase